MALFMVITRQTILLFLTLNKPQWMRSYVQGMSSASIRAKAFPPYFNSYCLVFDRVAVGTIFNVFGMTQKFESIYYST